MTSVVKPVDATMFVNVKPAQYAMLAELYRRIEDPGMSERADKLQDMLAQFALENGGVYDPARHRKGSIVRITVVV